MMKDNEDIYKETELIDKKLVRKGKIVYTKDDYFFIQPYETINPNLISRDSNVYSNLCYIDKSQHHLIEIGTEVKFTCEMGKRGLFARWIEVVE